MFDDARGELHQSPLFAVMVFLCLHTYKRARSIVEKTRESAVMKIKPLQRSLQLRMQIAYPLPCNNVPPLECEPETPCVNDV